MDWTTLGVSVIHRIADEHRSTRSNRKRLEGRGTTGMSSLHRNGIRTNRGTIPTQVGKYLVDDTSWFDVRLCDAGPMLSLCDEELNIRYTIIIEDGKVCFKEVEKLRPDEKEK
jgi:hypothetical protein